MKNEKETREKLLASAKQEFLEKGYMKASLRNICKNAGVTTGALYFFFQDKEDLFASLVQEPLSKLYQMMNAHYQEEMQLTIDQFDQIYEVTDDLETASQVVRFMYYYYDEFQLVLVKSQGSRFENCVDDFIEMTQKHYRKMADCFSEMLHVREIDDYMIHWIAHAQIDMFVHLLIHEKSVDEAVKHIEDIVKYLLVGWMGFFNLLQKIEK